MTQTQTPCPRCHGVVSQTRRVSLAISLAHHEPSCPGAPRPVKK